MQQQGWIVIKDYYKIPKKSRMFCINEAIQGLKEGGVALIFEKKMSFFKYFIKKIFAYKSWS